MSPNKFFIGRAIGLIIVLVVIGGIYFFMRQASAPEVVNVTTFEECVAAGNPVMESYPRQCRSKSGESFTEFLGNVLEKSDLIRLTSPLPNASISSPLKITGEARGNWFFEASFPVALTNWDGLIIAEGIATAKGEWMTTDFVPFEATLTFTVDQNIYSNRGTLILQKDNLSGLPEHDDALEIPVVLSNVTSGVQGVVTLGPTCPVMREGDTSCADKPYAVSIQIISVVGTKNSLFQTIKSGTDGTYKVILPPGDYILQPTTGSVMPSCESKNITIKASTMITANISCDTGIR